MITFLIPIKQSKYINNKTNFLKIFNRTLKYIRKLKNYNLIVIADHFLANQNFKNNEYLIKVDTSPFGYGDSDKEYKVHIGCRFWLDNDLSNHLMILDCDDLVLPEIETLILDKNDNLVMLSGYQKIFNKLYLHSLSDFYYRCGSSFIFSKKYIEERMSSYGLFKRWMFHQNHNLDFFTTTDIPCIIQIPFNGENIWWTSKKFSFKEVFKYFLSRRKFES